MQILVQKFGGISVQSAENRKHVIRHIQKAKKEGFKIVIVVSALGRKPDPYATDTLVELVQHTHGAVSRRELDLLMSCGETIAAVILSAELQQRQVKAMALTGAQAGIVTNADYNQAKIKAIVPQRIKETLETHDVVVVAGFQGQTSAGDTTTLGRGGSDTTAAALGAAFQAERIEIFTDVQGIMTADPRMVKQAKPIKTATYTEICNLAYQGAKVIHPRAVEIAMQAGIPMQIRSVYMDDMGTRIDAGNNRWHVSERLVTGIAHTPAIVQLCIETEAEPLRLQPAIFKAMAETGISVDFISISPSRVIFTVAERVADQAIHILQTLDMKVAVTPDCAKVSAVGAGMRDIPGVASKIVSALTDAGVQILQAADSHTTIWVLIHGKDVHRAVNAMHAIFELDHVNV
ncbi:aspartate kinase [Ornithinibacillus gellani]|uniref:aspartate kinase n=1 Tax=Ornithinibacillus gellani TaxID=2293253 RepID=UPI000F484F8D|nr:aspartate kinase [Ornithinibacillus gellani]TQS75506.1 aspartate kinase [Ornithinibacillus gellani]